MRLYRTKGRPPLSMVTCHKYLAGVNQAKTELFKRPSPAVHPLSHSTT